MLSAEWPKTSCIGKRRKRERKKERKEKKKKGRKKEKRIKRERKRKKGEKGWGKQSEIKKNMGEYLLILYTLSPLTSPGTCPSSRSSGGGACCADFQVLALGGAAQPLPGAGLSGVVYPVRPLEEQPQWRGQLRSPGVSSCSNSRALGLQGLETPGGAADLLSWGRSVLAVLGPPGLCLSRGRPDPVSYTHLTLPTTCRGCRSRWSPYH